MAWKLTLVVLLLITGQITSTHGDKAARKARRSFKNAMKQIVNDILPDEEVAKFPRVPSHERSASLERILYSEDDIADRMRDRHRHPRNPCDDLTLYDKSNRCVPYECFVFMKTHKTGSSTVVSITRRYVEAHKLRMMIKNKVDANWGWTEAGLSIKPDQILGYKSDVPPLYNSFDQHTRFTGATVETVRTLIPRAKYFTILREPVSRFVSAAIYYNWLGGVKRKLKKEGYNEIEFVQMSPGDNVAYARNLGSIIDNWEEITPYIGRGSSYNVVVRGMTWDLGYDEINDEALRALHRQYDLVMLMEYFDESMVLLRRLMCWSVEDMFYVAVTKREGKEHTGEPKPTYSSSKIASLLGRSQADKLKNIISDDMQLYEQFNKTFWDRVSEEEYFWEEVDLFRKARRVVQEECEDKPFGTYVCRAFHMKARMYLQRLLELYTGETPTVVDDWDILPDKLDKFDDDF